MILFFFVPTIFVSRAVFENVPVASLSQLTVPESCTVIITVIITSGNGGL